MFLTMTVGLYFCQLLLLQDQTQNDELQTTLVIVQPTMIYTLTLILIFNSVKSFSFQYRVKSVYKGHSMESEILPLMSSSLYRLKLHLLFINKKKCCPL